MDQFAVVKHFERRHAHPFKRVAEELYALHDSLACIRFGHQVSGKLAQWLWLDIARIEVWAEVFENVGHTLVVLVARQLEDGSLEGYFCRRLACAASCFILLVFSQVMFAFFGELSGPLVGGLAAAVDEDAAGLTDAFPDAFVAEDEIDLPVGAFFPFDDGHGGSP